MKALLWFFLMCFAFPTVSHGAEKEEFKCAGAYKGADGYKLKSTESSGGIKTSVFQSKGNDENKLVVKDDGKNVIVTRTTKRKLRSYDASEIEVESSTFDVSNNCRQIKYAEQKYALYGNQKELALEVNLNPENCQAIKSQISQCSGNPKLPKSIWNSSPKKGAAQLSGGNLYNLYALCGAKGLIIGPTAALFNTEDSYGQWESRTGIIPSQYRIPYEKQEHPYVPSPPEFAPGGPAAR